MSVKTYFAHVSLSRCAKHEMITQIKHVDRSTVDWFENCTNTNTDTFQEFEL